MIPSSFNSLKGLLLLHLFKRGREQKREKEGMEGEEERKAAALAERASQKEIGVLNF